MNNSNVVWYVLCQRGTQGTVGSSEEWGGGEGDVFSSEKQQAATTRKRF